MKLTVRHRNGRTQKVYVSNAYSILKDYDDYITNVELNEEVACPIAEDMASNLYELFCDEVERQIDNINFETCVIEDDYGYRYWE